MLAAGLLVVADGRDDAATCNITILFKRLRCVIFDDSSMGKEKKKCISQTILSMVFMCVPVSSISDLNQNIPQKHYGKLTTGHMVPMIKLTRIVVIGIIFTILLRQFFWNLNTNNVQCEIQCTPGSDVQIIN